MGVQGRVRWLPMIVLGGALCKAEASHDLENGFTFAPVLNWSFGGTQVEFSYGMNIAYWNFQNETPWSINLGIETSKAHGLLFSSEVQTGLVLAGSSAGVVYSQAKGFGVQGSVWGNVFLGAQLRYRYLDGSRFVPGTYFVIPAVKGSNNWN